LEEGNPHKEKSQKTPMACQGQAVDGDLAHLVAPETEDGHERKDQRGNAHHRGPQERSTR